MEDLPPRITSVLRFAIVAATVMTLAIVFASLRPQLTGGAVLKPKRPISTVTPTPTPSATATATAACNPGTPLTISTGGTYSGCYRSTSTSTPAVSIETTAAVSLTGARVEHTGNGITDTVNGTQLTVTDTTFQQLTLGSVVDHRAIDLTRPAAVSIEYNRFIDGDGVWLGGDSGTTNPPITFRYNYVTNIGHYKHPTGSGLNCCVSMIQLDHVKSSAIEVGWNKLVNTPGQSGGDGDQINFYVSGGTTSGCSNIGTSGCSNVHHNLIDGAYPDALNETDWVGGGINISDAVGAAHNMAHDNTVVSTTNYGVTANQNDNYAKNNVLVNDAAEQSNDGFGQAVQAYDNVTPAGLHTSGNQYNWKRSTSDSSQYACYQSTYCGNGTQVGTTEQQARDAWEAARTAASVNVGPR